jgi:hypothetical protein
MECTATLLTAILYAVQTVSGKISSPQAPSKAATTTILEATPFIVTFFSTVPQTYHPFHDRKG